MGFGGACCLVRSGPRAMPVDTRCGVFRPSASARPGGGSAYAVRLEQTLKTSLSSSSQNIRIAELKFRYAEATVAAASCQECGVRWPRPGHARPSAAAAPANRRCLRTQRSRPRGVLLARLLGRKPSKLVNLSRRRPRSVVARSAGDSRGRVHARDVVPGRNRAGDARTRSVSWERGAE